ncbi:MAG: hypothetical protein ABIH92_04750 [Nanoarchaeota archaeon]
MDERDIQRELEKALEVDDVLFEQLRNATRTGDPKLSVKELLMQHRGQPYFLDMLGKAKVMLMLRKYYDLKDGKKIEYWE